MSACVVYAGKMGKCACTLTPDMCHKLRWIVIHLAVPVLLFGACIVLLVNAQSSPASPQSQESLPDAPSAVMQSPEKSKTAANPAPGGTSQRVDAPWPREAMRGDEKISMYQPQLESWQDDELHAYAALSINRKGNHKPNYGVVWFTARTEVDKVNRQVTLANFQITKVKFPTLPDKEAEYQSFLQSKLPDKSRLIALDRLEAALAASTMGQAEVKGVPVKNDPPRVIFTTKPSLLVLIDGPAKFRDVGGTTLQKVLNSQAFILLDTKKGKYYLNVMDGWLEAPAMEGPWSYASKIPDDMKEITKAIQERQQATGQEGTAPPSLKQAQKDGKIPAIYVSFGPAELLATDGLPQLASLSGTNLEYVKNTTANIFRDPATSDYYVVLAGRWFRAKSLEGDSWEFVDPKSLPESFAKIPEDSPKAGVLASIPGTPPALEALIANSIPQTATITRGEAHLQVAYDGEPQFTAIEGTELQYAVNTATPVIRVADKDCYAVENAVWFVGLGPNGPWEVATKVPEVIYSIPPNSPLHYVTYVKVYRSTPEVVYVGYTPGYYGTVVSSTTTTVVYGTGWYYPPYIGNYWYGAPYTYGVGVATTWSSGTGWSVTIGVGYSYGYPYYYPYYPWWGPWGYYGPCCWGPAWGYGYGGYAATNVYGRWGNTAYANTRAAWANPYTGNYGAASRTGFQNTQRGTVGVAGRGYNTNIYTGNTVAGRGAAAYDPKTGIAVAGGAGYAGNMYTGQGAVGRGGIAYNTNTGAGVAVGNNNVYAGKDGTVYRYDRQNGNWSQNTGSGWESANRPQANLQQQQQARYTGQQRTQNFSRSMGGGMRMGGGGRRR
ncbi:MAG TPA: hypothetical protein VMG82_10480 [Candidatus Sulfotelmatobacter sp.]|nr:hypothetical protein [Candidatus Sulfotelmatobacter sp.]